MIRGRATKITANPKIFRLEFHVGIVIYSSGVHYNVYNIHVLVPALKHLRVNSSISYIHTDHFLVSLSFKELHEQMNSFYIIK